MVVLFTEFTETFNAIYPDAVSKLVTTYQMIWGYFNVSFWLVADVIDFPNYVDQFYCFLMLGLCWCIS